MSKYGRKLTRAELEFAGITEITDDCRIFRGEVEIKPFVNGQHNYLCIAIYDRDENNNLIKINRKDGRGYTYKYRTLGLHRVMYAWHYGEVPEGMVVDHRDNCHTKLEDYRLENLQLLLPKENLEKERGESVREKPIPLSRVKPLHYYEAKLDKYLDDYDLCKRIGDAKGAHKCRTQVANYKAYIRWWKNHEKEIRQYFLDSARDRLINTLF